MKLKSIPFDKIVQATYCLFLVPAFIPYHQELKVEIVFGLIVLLVVASIASMIQTKRLSFAVWPTLVLVAAAPAVCVSLFAGASNAPGAIGAFLFLVTSIVAAVMMCACLLFAQKDIYKLLLIYLLSAGFVIGMDLLFITEDEIGEKGTAFYLQDHADWRVVTR